MPDADPGLNRLEREGKGVFDRACAHCHGSPEHPSTTSSLAQSIPGLPFNRYHDVTVAVLTGFMLGSLRKVWPWKVDVEFMTDRHGARIPTVQHNVLPDGFTGDVMIAIALAVTGLVVVLVLDWWAARLDPEERPGS